MFAQIPVVNSVEALADIVRADLLAREIIPSEDRVVYSNGEPGQRTTPGQNQLPMVWFWLEPDFSIDVGQTGDPTNVAMVAMVDGQAVDAGTSIAVEKMRARVVVHAKDPEGATTPAPRRGRVFARNAETAGAQLRHRVLAAIWRACTGSFRVLGAKNHSPMGSEFAYGCCTEMSIELYYHVADDAFAKDEASAEGTQFAEGEQVAEVDLP